MMKLLPCVTPDDYYVLPQYYSGSKRARYTQATDQVIQEGVTRKDSHVKMFVKFEKLDGDVKINPDPRAIQFRDPKYCVEVAKYLKPCEHAIYLLHGDGTILPRSRVIGKGLSSNERGQLLHKKLLDFDNPVVLSLDASRFDQHCDVELLKLEHSFYTHMCYDPWFAQLLSWQLLNYGRTSKGLKYIARGKRMSGDMNTALGNCLLMVLMVSTFMRGKKYDILDDGDDCLLIVEKELVPWVRENIQATFLTYGHELKIEHEAETIEEVEWCQGHPVEYRPGKYKFVRDPAKVISGALIGSKYFVSEGARAKLINTIGMAELILNLGVPVLQEYALALCRNASTSKSIEFDEIDSMYYRLHRELRRMNLRQLERVAPKPITSEARLSFAKAFSIDVTEQLAMEEFFRCWNFPIQGCVELGPDRDLMWNKIQVEQPDLTPMWE